MMEFITDVVYATLLYLGIAIAWTVLEKLIYGKATPSIIHDVVAIALAISLLINFK